MEMLVLPYPVFFFPSSKPRAVSLSALSSCILWLVVNRRSMKR